MKYAYYLSLVICGLILGLILFGPYGGALGILKTVERGFYDLDYIQRSFGEPVAKIIVYLNRVIAFAFFAALILCLLLPFLNKIPPAKKYEVTFIYLIIIGLIAFSPNLICKNKGI